MDIGSRIRFYRQTRHISQQQLASGIGMAPAQLCRYEKGRAKPKLAVLARIAKALQVPVADFFVGS